MKMIESADKKGFNRELVNIKLGMRKLLKDPHSSIQDHIVIHIVFSLICSILTVVLPFTAAEGAILSGIMLGFALYFIFRLIIILRSLSKANKTDVKRNVEIDDEGIESIREGQSFKVFWNGIKCMKICRFSVIFIPNNSDIMMFTLPVENLESVMAILKEKNIDIPVIK